MCFAGRNTYNICLTGKYMENQINNKEEQELGCFDDINFQELEEVFKKKKEALKEKNKVALLVVAVIFLISVFIAIFFGYNFWIFVFVLSIFYFASLYSKTEQEILDEMAERNNLFRQKTIPINELKGNLFKVRCEKAVGNVLVGRYKEKKTRFFNHTHTYYHNRAKTVFYFTVLEIFFDDISFPYMLLQYKRDLPFKSIRYGAKERDERKITLEDDFDRYYNLFIKDGYGVEAMQIFRDDFLIFLIKEECNFSIELKDDRMYIYLRERIIKYNEFKELFTTAGETIKRISPLLTRLKRDFDVLKAHYNKQ